MKTLRIFGLMLVTGTQEDKVKIEQLAAGTHHVHRNQPGGQRKAKLTSIAIEKETVINGETVQPGTYPIGQEAPHVSD